MNDNMACRWRGGMGWDDWGERAWKESGKHDEGIKEQDTAGILLISPLSFPPPQLTYTTLKFAILKGTHWATTTTGDSRVFLSWLVKVTDCTF